VFYAEGIYETVTSDDLAEDVPFSMGRWSSIPIPFLYGRFRPAAPKLYVVSAGFEGNKTLRVLERDDPERIVLVFPVPGVIPAYEEQVRLRNEPILARFGMLRDSILTAAAGDAIGAWSLLERHSLERSTEDVCYLCCGTKAHSLGMALRAFATKAPTVFYNVPERHNFVPVSPSGSYWTYRIVDLSALTTVDK
jgi:hypothetical protein